MNEPSDHAAQGGFARVFEVEDKAGSRLAIKVVTKNSLKTKKAKTKVRHTLLAWISLIDQSNIVVC